MPISIVTRIITTAVRLLAHLSARRGPAVYKPEKYYMRGPGPQWHAKHDRPGG